MSKTNKFCMIGEHSEASDKENLLSYERALIALKIRLNEAKSDFLDLKNASAGLLTQKQEAAIKKQANLVKITKNEVDATQAEIDKLRDLDRQKWVILTDSKIDAAKFKLVELAKIYKDELNDAEKYGNKGLIRTIKSDFKNAKEGVTSLIKHYESKHGVQSCCQSCIAQIHSVFAETKEISTTKVKPVAKAVAGVLDINNLPEPKEIRDSLDQDVIAQDYAKVVIASQAAMHYRRVASYEAGKRDKVKNSNIMLVGPTGVGKTELIRSLEKFLATYMGEIPVITIDATEFTEAGYVGEDVTSIPKKLAFKAISSLISEASASGEKFDLAKSLELVKYRVEHGIIHIDEIDKLANTGGYVGGSVSRGGVQSALLKLIEGGKIIIPIPAGQPGMVYNIEVDTTKILVIASGAFESGAGGKNVLKISQEEDRKPYGFLDADDLKENTSYKDDNYEDNENGLDDIEPEDLIKYGMMPELIGRFSVVATLPHLTINAIRRIMTEPKDAEYPGLLKDLKEFYDIDLVIEQNALKALAQKAHDRKTGARAVNSILTAATFVIAGFPGNYKGRQVIITEESLSDTKLMKVIDRETGEEVGNVKSLSDHVTKGKKTSKSKSKK